MKLSSTLLYLGMASTLAIPSLVNAQSIFSVGPDSHPRLVVDLTEDGKPMIDGEKEVQLAPAEWGEPSMLDFDLLMPGIIMVDNPRLKTRNLVTSEGHIRKLIWRAKLNPNRDLSENWMAFRWANEEEGNIVRLVKLPDLKKHEPTQVRFEITIPEGVKNTADSIHFYSGGYEVKSSETAITPNSPRQQFVESVEGGMPPDGPAQIMTRTPVPVSRDQDGNRIHGTVRLKLYYDIDGYVYKAEVLNPKYNLLEKECLRVAPLWTIKPAFRDGHSSTGTIEVSMASD